MRRRLFFAFGLADLDKSITQLLGNGVPGVLKFKGHIASHFELKPLQGRGNDFRKKVLQKINYKKMADAGAAYCSVLLWGCGYGKPPQTEPKKPGEACYKEVNMSHCEARRTERAQPQQQQL